MSDVIAGAGVFDWSAQGVGGSIQQDQTENESAHSPSETAMLNEALSQVGASRITGIDDESPNANYCKDFYPPLLDAILRMHDWKFAGTRALLTKENATPAFGYNFIYKLPANLIKLREFNNWPVTDDGLCMINSSDYQLLYSIEGRNLLTSAAQVYIKYTRRVRDVGQWDPLFYQVVCTWLASKLAKAIPKDTKKANDLLIEANNVLLPMAVAALAQEGPQEMVRNNALTWGR